MNPRILGLLLLPAFACHENAPNPEPPTPLRASSAPAAQPPSPRAVQAPPGPSAAAPVPSPVPEPPPAPAPLPPPTVDEARLVLEGMRALAAAGNPSSLVPYVPKRDRTFLHRPASEILAALSGKVLSGEVQGGRVILSLERPPDPDAPRARPVAPTRPPARGAKGASLQAAPEAAPPPRYAVFLRRSMGFRYDPVASERWAPPDPGPAVPQNHDVPLAEAIADLPGKGRLVAEIDTSAGRLTCGLFPEKAPRAVATFVGLARGRRAFLDPSTGTWVRRPFYDGQVVHRTAPGTWFGFGCPGPDECPGVGFSVPDELDLSLRHDLPGRLGIDTGDRPNQGAARLYVTAAADPERDDRSPIFGQCGPLDVITRITQAGGRDSHQEDPVVIRQVTFRREEAAAP